MLYKLNNKSYIYSKIYILMSMFCLINLPIYNIQANTSLEYIISDDNNGRAEKYTEFGEDKFLLGLIGEDILDQENVANVVFKDHLFLYELKASSKNTVMLETTKLTSHYSERELTRVDLGDITKFTSKAEYNSFKLQVAKNSDNLYLLLTNNNEKVRKNKSLLFKSDDGFTWTLFKKLRAEWELDQLEVNNNNISVTCTNCEDVKKLAYIISTDNGKSWEKYSLPEGAEEDKLPSKNTDDNNKVPSGKVNYASSGITNTKLFALIHPQNNSQEYKLYSKDLTNKESKWVKTNLDSLLSLNKLYNDKEAKFNFSGIEQVYDLDDYLVAAVNYEFRTKNSEEDEDETVVKKTYLWSSINNGDTWELVNLDLADNKVKQLNKHHNKLHLVTAKNHDFKLLIHLIFSEGLSVREMIMKSIYKYIENQEYNYYSLSKEQLLGAESFSLAPKFTFTNAYGYNLFYRSNPVASYTDAVIINYNKGPDQEAYPEGPGIRLSIYRLYD